MEISQKRVVSPSLPHLHNMANCITFKSQHYYSKSVLQPLLPIKLDYDFS